MARQSVDSFPQPRCPRAGTGKYGVIIGGLVVFPITVLADRKFINVQYTVASSAPVEHKQLLKDFNAPFRVLMGPGPSDVDPRVLRAMSQSLLSHLDPVFIEIMDEVQHGLQQVFETDNPLTIPMSGSGTAGMETAMVNMIEPGDDVLACTAGFFGHRMADIAKRAGGNVRLLETPWGETIQPDRVQAAIEEHRPRIVAFVHVETSTGVSQPIDELATVLDHDDIVTIVDCVASLGGEPIDVTRNGLDFVYSGSQKCLSCPPGLSPVTLSEKALEKLASRKTPVQSWYLDLSMIREYWGSDRRYHHTAPVSLHYAMREALRLIDDEGLANRFGRHRQNHLALVAGLEAMGLEMFAREEVRAWTVNTVKIPEGIDDAELRLETPGALRNRNRWRARRSQGQDLENRLDGLVLGPQQCPALSRRDGRDSVRDGLQRPAWRQELLRPPTVTTVIL